MKLLQPLVRTGILLAAAISAPASAATIAWSGTTDSAWNTGSNWAGNSAPADDMTTDSAVFSLVAYPNQPDAFTNSVAGLVFGDGSTATAPVEILGDMLTIGAGGIDMKANAGAATLDTPITLGAAQSWINNSSNPLATADVNGGFGPVTNGGFDLTVDGSGPVRLGRGMSGTGGVVKNGSGTLILAGAHNYTGATTVNAGTLEFGDGASGTLPSAITNNTALKYNSSTNMVLSGAISGAGTITKEGTGVLTLAGANTFSVAPTIIAGTLQMRRGTTFANIPGFTVNSGATLDFDTNGATWAVPAKPISLNGGTLSMTANGVEGRYATGFGQVTLTAPSTLKLNVASAAGSAPNASCFFLDPGVTGSSALTIEGGNVGRVGVVFRTAATDLSGTITVNGLANTAPLSATGLALGLSATLGTPNLTKANLEVNGTFEIGRVGMGWAGGILATGSVPAAINGLSGTGVVTSNGAARVLSIGNDNGGGDFSGQLANGTAAASVLSLDKLGTGTQILSGDNSFTGITTVGDGILRLNHENALKASVYNTDGTGALVFGSEVSGDAFTLGGLTGSGNLALANSAAAPITLSVGNTTSTYAGQITGSGSLEKIGSGTLTLGGSSIHSGTTTVSGGRLNLAGGLTNSALSLEEGGSLGGEGNAKSITLNGGTLMVDPTTPGTLTSDTGLSITGPVAVTLSAVPSGSGPIAVLKHTGSFTGSLANFVSTDGRAIFTDTAGTISMQLGAGATRTWVGTDGTWENGGSGSFWVEGDQKFLNGDNAIFPDSAGPKVVTLSGALQPASTTVTNTTGNNYSFTGGTLAGAGGITKNGTGALTTDNAHTFTGAVNVNGGTISSAGASTGTGCFLGGVGTSAAHRVVTIAPGASISYTYGTANGFLNLGAGAPATGGYGSFYDFNISGVLAINDGVAVSQILQSTYNLSNGGEISNTGTAHTGAYGLLFGWNGTGGGNITATGTGNKITADRIGFFNGATITTNAGADLTISGIVKNGSATASVLNKAGAGTLILAATANSYTGATSVTGGTLKVNGTKTGAGAVAVATGGTIAGSGSVAGAVTIQSGGTLAPGNTTGNLSFTSTVNLASGASYVAEIAGASSNDKVTSTGTFTANGTIKVTLVDGYSPATGTTFDLVDATIAGTPVFDFSAATLATGLSWDTTSFATNGTIKVTGTATGSPYDSWATTNNITGGKNGDDDNDGVSNFLEYATAANPKSGSSGARAYSLMHTIGGQKVLTYTVAVRAAASFAANGAKQQADKDGVRYVVEGSDQLGTWNSVVVSELAPADGTAVQAALGAQLSGLDAAWQWRSFRTDGDAASDASDYIRLNVTETP